MSFKIIKNDNFKVHDLSDGINELIKLINLQSGSLVIQYSFCCRENNEIITFCANKNNEFSFFSDTDIKTAFINFIKLLTNENKFNIEISYKILLLAEKISFNDDELFELFKVVNWQSYKKGKYFFDLMKDFLPGLMNMLFNNKISLKEACYFHQTFINQNYDIILKEISERLSYSVTNEIIRNIADYSKKSLKNSDEILKIIKGSDDLLNLSVKLKYPDYTKCLKEFNIFLNELNIPKGSEIIFDGNFEKEEYFLKIKFTDLENLIKKINAIKNNFEKFFNEKKEDKFIQKNLFKNQIKKTNYNE